MTAPRVSAISASGSGTSAAAAPATTRGRRASHCAETTARVGWRPRAPSCWSNSRRADVPTGAATNGIPPGSNASSAPPAAAVEPGGRMNPSSWLPKLIAARDWGTSAASVRPSSQAPDLTEPSRSSLPRERRDRPELPGGDAGTRRPWRPWGRQREWADLLGTPTPIPGRLLPPPELARISAAVKPPRSTTATK